MRNLLHPLWVMALLVGTVAAQAATSLPGGATVIDETHGDWVVHCEARNAAVVCALQQQQTDTNSGQRLLAIEMVPQDGGLRGTLMLPFGLALQPGIQLRLDEAEPLPALRFRTCLPAGCLVDLAFDAAALGAVRAVAKLGIEAIADGGAPARFSISFAGFTSALDRVTALLQ